MSETSIGEHATGAFRGDSMTPSAAGWLGLAATPTFAIMAVLAGVMDGAAPNSICSASSPLNGMATMYALMSAFHLAPWLRLVFGR